MVDMNYVENPNLPQNAVKSVVVSPINSPLISGLEAVGINCICTELGDLNRFPVSHHADMTCCHLGGERIIVSKEGRALGEKLAQSDFEVKYAQVGESYPTDCSLNCAIIGDLIFAKKENISREISEYFQNNSKETHYVNQGYAKCSVAIVAQNAIITADRGIAAVAVALGMDVLEIPAGSIAINGYSYGFIGGCCGKLAGDILGFCGNIKAHPAYDDIKSFTMAHGVYCEPICGGDLFDVGGILPVIEKFS